MFDPVLFMLVTLASYVVGVVHARMRYAARHAQDDADARTHGFERTKPVSLRRGLTVYRATRSYLRDPVRVDLYYDREADHSLVERLGWRVPDETYALSFPDDVGYPQATIRRISALSSVGRTWDFADRFPELLDVDIETRDVERLMPMFDDPMVAYLADLPKNVQQVWVRDGRVYHIVRAGSFEDLMGVMPLIEPTLSAFAKR